MARIPLRDRSGEVRAYAHVDEADFEWLNQWRWHLTPDGYAARNAALPDGTRYIKAMHRQILSLEYGDRRQGDHRNRNRLDCRRANLRIAHRAQADNVQNTSSRGGYSKYRGVTLDRGRWKAQVGLDGRNHHLGRFDSESEAAEAARRFRREHMEFADA